MNSCLRNTSAPCRSIHLLKRIVAGSLSPPPTASSVPYMTSRAALKVSRATAGHMISGSRERGFTYVCGLLLVAMTGAALGSVAEAWSHARQREKEAELVWVGNQ